MSSIGVTAWASVIGLLSIQQVPLPGTSSVSVPLSPVSACARCHGGYDTIGSAFDTWAGSAMAHSARDPLFRAALVEAEKDVQGVGDFCLRCHAPEAWVNGRCFPTDGSALLPDDGGVTCSLCHRMDENPYVRNGQYILAANESDIRGPYGDSDAPHRKKQSVWLSDSRLCGTCHDLHNPLVRRRTLTGTLTDQPFPEQTTYSEWAQSAFAQPGGQSCADCHMQESTGVIAEDGMMRPDRSSHALSGGNVFLLEAIAFLEPSLGLSSQLALGRARNIAILREAATIELVEPQGTVARGQVVDLTLRVTNETGHKLPTGYPEGRRVVVQFESEDLGVDLGAYDIDTREPVDPVAIFRTVHGQATEGPGHHLALNDTIYFDNRIPPRGFVPTTTTAPVGVTYPEGPMPGTLAHWADVTVTATIPCDVNISRISGRWRVVYESVTKEYVDILVDAAGKDVAGERLEAAYVAVDPQPIEMAALSIDLTIDPASSCDPPDAGFVDAAAPDASDSTDSGHDGGVASDAVVGVDTGGTTPPDDEGCGCVTSHRSKSYGLDIFGVLMSLSWFVRRRVRSAR